MISFQVINSDSPEVLGNLTIFKNRLTLGGDGQVDFFLPSPLNREHLFLFEIKDTSLKIYPQQLPYLLNGKRATGPRVLKKQDRLLFAKTEIVIMDFSFTPIENRRDYLKRRLGELIEQRSPILKYFAEIQKEEHES